MSTNTLDSFTILISEIFGSLLSNPLNQRQWVEPLTKDVLDKLNDIAESVAIVKSNKVYLPLPINGRQFTEIIEQIAIGCVLRPTFQNAFCLSHLNNNQFCSYLLWFFSRCTANKKVRNHATLNYRICLKASS